MSDDETPKPPLTLHIQPVAPQSDEVPPEPAPYPKPSPDPTVIAELENWLLMARSGELRAVLVQGSMLYVDGHTKIEASRSGMAGTLSYMMAASLAEQHAYELRHAILEHMEEAEPPESAETWDGWQLDAPRTAETLSLVSTDDAHELVLSRMGDLVVTLFPPGPRPKLAMARKTFATTGSFSDAERCAKAADWANRWIGEQVEVEVEVEVESLGPLSRPHTPSRPQPDPREIETSGLCDAELDVLITMCGRGHHLDTQPGHSVTMAASEVLRGHGLAVMSFGRVQPTESGRRLAAATLKARGKSDCDRCEGAGWVRGSDLDEDPDHVTDQRYDCPECREDGGE